MPSSPQPYSDPDYHAERVTACWCGSQGAQVMSSHGVNVPPGIPAFTLDEVQKAADQMASADGEVRIGFFTCSNFTPEP